MVSFHQPIGKLHPPPIRFPDDISASLDKKGLLGDNAIMADDKSPDIPMNIKGERELYDRLWNTIDVVTQEWDVSHYQVAGVLSRIQHNINVQYDQILEDQQEDDYDNG